VHPAVNPDARLAVERPAPREVSLIATAMKNISGAVTTKPIAATTTLSLRRARSRWN